MTSVSSHLRGRRINLISKRKASLSRSIQLQGDKGYGSHISSIGYEREDPSIFNPDVTMKRQYSTKLDKQYQLL